MPCFFPEQTIRSTFERSIQRTWCSHALNDCIYNVNHITHLQENLCLEKKKAHPAQISRKLHKHRYISPKDLSKPVSELLSRCFSFLRIPADLSNDFQTPPVSTFPAIQQQLRHLNVESVRERLKRREIRKHLEKGGVDLCISMLEFCTAEDNVDKLDGLYLIPLCDGSIGAFSRASSRPYVILNEHQQPLLSPWIPDHCVNPKALKSFLNVFDTDSKRKKVGLCT